MAFKYNTNTPTKIKYADTNGTYDTKYLIYNNKHVWSQPYSLKITGDNPDTVSVRREEGCGYPLGVTAGNLSNNSLIYHGETLQVSRPYGSYSYIVSDDYVIDTSYLVSITSTTKQPQFTIGNTQGSVTVYWDATNKEFK